MFSLNRPSDKLINEFLRSEQLQQFSYGEVGYTRSCDKPPLGYRCNYRQVKVGEGVDVFEKAVATLKVFGHMNFDWVKVFCSEPEVKVGANIAVLAKHCHFWSLNACRVVYVLAEDGPIRRFCFANGTLAEHALAGEERFQICLNTQDNVVTYDVFAFSRPCHTLAKVGYPAVRILQRRFGEDSINAICKHGPEDSWRNMAPNSST
jgi:uncharacterized protein (UPF0548 family)